MSELPEISIVVCVFDEAENIAPLLSQIETAVKGFYHEIIFVDDGSSDLTLHNLRECFNQRLRIVELRKNYGQSLALSAGIHLAKGEFIVTMDGDLQNDPSDIPAMLALCKEGNWDLVAGIRKDRKDNMFLRKVPSKIANWIIRRSSGIEIADYGCTLKLFRQEIAKDLGLYGELHRFIPVLAHLEGARITQMEVRHHPRIHGNSKYGMGRTLRVISDLMLMIFFKKYLQRPMHLFGGLGVTIFIVGILINLYMIWLKFEGQDIWGKPLMLVGILFVLAGIQLVTFGIFVELQMRTYYESQQKTPYRIRNLYEPKGQMA
ncbi:MAG: glycosyltransferase family 2 protein [Saprospiraceae bacterium]|nr:glycosyltransferase family 2 protein [Saprospiraceae bacterium]